MLGTQQKTDTLFDKGTPYKGVGKGRGPRKVFTHQVWHQGKEAEAVDVAEKSSPLVVSDREGQMPSCFLRPLTSAQVPICTYTEVVLGGQPLGHSGMEKCRKGLVRGNGTIPHTGLVQALPGWAECFQCLQKRSTRKVFNHL